MPKQLDLLNPGQRRKERGIRQVENSCANFLALMRLIACRISREQSSVSSDDLREYADKHSIRPLHKNAWGAVFREGRWVAIGRKRSTYRTNNARWITIWKLMDDYQDGKLSSW